MVDSGSSVSLVKEQVLNETLKILTHKAIFLQGVAPQKIRALGEISLDFEKEGISFNHNFQVVKNSFSIYGHGLLGRDFFQKFKAILDYDTQLLQIKVKENLLEFPLSDTFNDDVIILPPRCEVIRKIKVTQSGFFKSSKH